MRTRRGRKPVLVFRVASGQEVSTGTSSMVGAVAFYHAWRAGSRAGSKPGDGAERRTLSQVLDDFEATLPDTVNGDRLRVVGQNLRAVFGDRVLTEVTPRAREEYRAARVVKRSKVRRLAATGTIRNELSHLQHVLTWASKGTAWKPLIELTPPGEGRLRWLEPREVAALICAARGRVWDSAAGGWRRDPATGRLAVDPLARERYAPVVRLVLLGTYTGTRVKAMLAAGWTREDVGGAVDLEDERLYRRGVREPESRKRRPSARLCKQLLRHAKRWRAEDDRLEARMGRPVERVIHEPDGRPLADWYRRFNEVRDAAGLGPDVTTHVLRHTCAMYLLEGRALPEDAAELLGMTVETLEGTYDHPDANSAQAASRDLEDWGLSEAEAAKRNATRLPRLRAGDPRPGEPPRLRPGRREV